MMNDANNSNREGKNPIRENLETQFQSFRPEEEAPQKLKSEVFNTLDTLSLLADVIDLFTLKFTRAETELFTLFKAPKATPEEDEA